MPKRVGPVTSGAPGERHGEPGHKVGRGGAAMADQDTVDATEQAAEDTGRQNQQPTEPVESDAQPTSEPVAQSNDQPNTESSNGRAKQQQPPRH